MVPNGWKENKLGVVSEFQRGFDLPSRIRQAGDVPIISSSGVSGYHNEHKVEPPGVVTGRYGSIGEVFYVEKNYWPLNTSLWVKNFHGNDPKFIYYLLSNFDFKKFSDKTGVPGVNRNDLHAVKVLTPPLTEQRKIATIFGTWDKAISTTERLIDNSKQQKKALMQQLLTGKKRLLDDSGKPFEGEWKEVKFGDCISHFGGTALEKHVSEDATHHFISIGNYSMDGKYVDKGQRVALNEKTSAKLLQKGELVMVLNDKTKTGDIIGSTILIDEYNKYIYNQRSERIIPKGDIYITFFWFLLNSSKFRAEVFNRSQGGTQIYINFSSVKAIQIKLPSIFEQKKIAAVLTNANKEIELLEQQLTDLKLEKKALMQQLLTGKRRVKVDDKEVV